MSTAQNLFGDDIATNNSLALLRRLVKLSEAGANVDIANRQRIIIDAITPSLTLGVVTTVSTVTNLGTIAGYDQRQWQDQSRIAYNTGIRSQLSFT